MDTVTIRTAATTALIMCTIHAAAVGLIYTLTQTPPNGLVWYFSIYAAIVLAAVVALVKTR